MNIVLKFFTYLMAFAIVLTPCYSIADALQQPSQAQRDVLPRVETVVDQSVVNAFKARVDEAKRSSEKKYIRKNGVRNPVKGFLKGVVTYWLASISYVFLVFGAVFVIAATLAFNIPALIVGGLFVGCGVFTVNATCSLGESAYNDFTGCGELVAVHDNDCFDENVLYMEENRRRI